MNIRALPCYLYSNTERFPSLTSVICLTMIREKYIVFQHKYVIAEYVTIMNKNLKGF